MINFYILYWIRFFEYKNVYIYIFKFSFNILCKIFKEDKEILYMFNKYVYKILCLLEYKN